MTGLVRARWGHSGRRQYRPAWARSWLLVLAAVATFGVPVQFAGTANAQGGVPGTLDPTFDTDGVAINELVSNLAGVQGAERLPDGRVLVLADGHVWRFFPDGTLDTGFDLDGVLLPASSATMRPANLALRPGGGFVLSTGGGTFDPTCPAGRVAKFDQDGHIVTAFGVNGVACIGFPNFEGALISGLAVQDDGKPEDERILVLGSNQAAGGASHIALARLDATGATVNTVIQPLHSTFEGGDALAVQPDGNIVVVGDTNNFPNFLSIGVVISRYLGGTLALDTSYGGGDGFNVESVFLDRSKEPLRLAMQADGQGVSVIAAGDNPSGPATRVAAIEQLLFDGDGILADSPVDMELTGHAFAVVDDLTATPTGYVATGHTEDTAAGGPTVDGMVVAALGQEFTDAVPLLISHPRANLPLAGARSLLLPDGRVLVTSVLEGPAGEQFLFNRLVEDAAADPRTVTLDPTIGTAFGQAGFRTVNALTADRGTAVAVQPDGNVLVGGLTTAARGGPAGPVGGNGFVLRHNENGTLDQTFGSPLRNGVAFVDFKVNGVALAPGGRVVAVGSQFFPADGEGTHEAGAVQQLLSDGSPDPNWNKGKPLFLAPPDNNLPGTFFRDVAVQPDGSVVVVGDYHVCVSTSCADNPNFIVVARLLPGGTLDDGFGEGGFTLIGPVRGQSADLALGGGIVLQPDGLQPERIVVTGSLGSNLVLARLDLGGHRDPTFGAPGPFGTGVLADDFVPGGTDRAVGRDIALRPDGRLVVSGDLVVRDCSQVVACFTRSFAIAAQYLPAGTRDNSFGSGGLTRIGPTASQGRGVALDAVGNVVVAAAVPGTGPDLVLARLLPAGTPDTQFGTNGVVLTPVGQSAAANAVAIAPDGKIVVAGVNGDTRGNRVLTARFESGAALQCTSPLDFGDVVLGTGAATGTVTCKNTGPSRLRIGNVTLAGANAADFVVSTDGCSQLTLPAGQSCTMTVAFTPGAVGTRVATLSVPHNGQGAAGGPIPVELRGQGVARDTTLGFTPLNFPEQLGLTTSPARPVTVTNIGTVSVTIDAVGIENGPAGEFAVPSSKCTGATLAPHAQCQLSVTFTPRAPGRRSATLRLDVFDDSGASGPHRLPLSGIGATPTVLVNPGVGQPGTMTFATGAKFPPKRAISLVWVEPGSLLPAGFPEPAFSVTSNADGTLTASTIVFPRSRIGGRTLQASFGAFSANAPFLVLPGSAQPPDFLYRN